MKAAVITQSASQQQYLNLQSLPKIKHGSHQGTPLSKHQVVKLFRLLFKTRTPLALRSTGIFAVLLGCGLRRSEVANINLHQYNTDKASIFIAKGKGNKNRTVFLPDWVQVIVDEWLEPTAYYFAKGAPNITHRDTAYSYSLLKKDKVIV